MAHAVRWSEHQLNSFLSLRSRCSPYKPATHRMRHSYTSSTPTSSPSVARTPTLSRITPDTPFLAQAKNILEQMNRSIFLGAMDSPVTEEDHQRLIFQFLSQLAVVCPEYADDILDIYGTANGGKRHRGAAGRLKASGARTGVPDIEAWLPRTNEYGRVVFGLVIELKRPASPGRSKGRATLEQKARLARLQKRGYKADIICGWLPACESLATYLNLPIPDRPVVGN